MVTFTINIPQMLVYIPYMDPMGNEWETLVGDISGIFMGYHGWWSWASHPSEKMMAWSSVGMMMMMPNMNGNIKFMATKPPTSMGYKWDEHIPSRVLVPNSLRSGKSMEMVQHTKKITYEPCSSIATIAGWWFEPLWKILVNWDDYSQYMGK